MGSLCFDSTGKLSQDLPFVRRFGGDHGVKVNPKLQFYGLRFRRSRLALQSKRVTNEIVALAKHLLARLRVLEIMIKVFPGNQVAFATGCYQALRHEPGLLDVDV